MKRIIAFLLCLCMMVTLLPVQSFAADDTPPTEETPNTVSEPEQASEAAVNPDPDAEANPSDNPADAADPEQESEPSPEPAPSSETNPEQEQEQDLPSETNPEPEQEQNPSSETEPEPDQEQNPSSETELEPDQEQDPSSDAEPEIPTETDPEENLDADLLATSLAAAAAPGTGVLMYLSDYTTSEMIKCQVGWGTYCRDKGLENNQISLYVGGEGGSRTLTYFDKGITAHASAELIYDLGENHQFNYFRSYIGVDARKDPRGSVSFHFYGSTDNSNWTELVDWNGYGTTFTGGSTAAYVDLNVTDYRYFKVFCDKGAEDGYDHSVLADAQFISANYVAPTLDILQSEEDINAIGTILQDKLGSNTSDYTSVIDDSDSELELLQYRLVTACDYDKLVQFLTTSVDSQDRINAFTWLYTNLVPLREFMNGGVPNGGSYLAALDVLSDLYAAYSEDLEDSTELYSPETGSDITQRGDVYRHMMLTMSLVCAGGLNAWLARTAAANPVNRYAYFKENYENGKMRNDIFENLGVDEMRWVLGNNISDAEIVWLNDYARKHPRYGTQTWFPILYSPHHHISYRWYNYDKEELYSDDNKSYYIDKYMLSGYEKYGLTYGLVNGQKVQRLWMVFEDGAVCGNISRTGANLAACFGVPACEVGQPGHAAFLIMNKNASTGEMTWGIDNDISGWMVSCNSRRMPCDWGQDSDTWISGWRVSYILLAQAALNDLDNYSKAEEAMMLYDLCSTDAQREQCCRAALSYMSFHLDAWLKLVQMYCADGSKSAEDLADLAEELCSEENKLCYYPKPMNDLVQLLLTRIKAISDATTDSEQKSAVEAQLSRCRMILNAGFVRGSNAATGDCAQPDVCRSNANYFLGSGTYALATFSFDGNNANKLVFNSDFTSVRFKYSLDGGANWSESQSLYADSGTPITFDLTDELGEINYTTDIHIWLDGWAGDPNVDGSFTIDIKQGADVSGIEFNDNENRFLGAVSGMEYHLEGSETWTELTTDLLFEDVQTITVRKKANGTTMLGNEKTYSSTADNTTTRKYITISHLSVASFSSQEASRNDYAAHVIDGLTSTRWHTLWNNTDSGKFIVLKTDEPHYFSGLDYKPDKMNGNVGTNGTITGCVVEVSLDGTSWMTAATVTNWADNDTLKQLDFSPVYGQYIRIRVTSSHGGYVSAQKFELFEDTELAKKTLKGITLLSKPTKLTYVRGEKLDLTGASAKVIYSDDSTSQMDAAQLTPDVTVLNTVGNQKITLAYGNQTVSFYVTVKERSFTPTEITLVNQPNQLTCYVGDEIRSEGMVLTATDGTTTVYLTEDEYTVAGNTATVGEQTVTVTMKATGLTATYPITVKKSITALNVVTTPTEHYYELGESFNPDGLTVQAVYADGETAMLDDTQYLLEDTDSFSEKPGDPEIRVVLSDKASVYTTISVTVYPYFTLDGITYSVDLNGTCEVTAITDAAADNGFVSIPERVYRGSTAYTVIGIASKALDNTSGITAIALPGTVTSLDEHALDGSPDLATLYLTAHTSFASLKVAEDALNPAVEIILYASDDNLKADLNSVLEKSLDAEDMVNLNVGNVRNEISSITATPPTVCKVALNKEIDWTGYGVTATLNNGTVVPLANGACTRTTPDTTSTGEKTVTVSLKDSTLETTFTITVMDSDLHFITHPESAVYFTSDSIVQPLTVNTADTNNDTVIYSWYCSKTGVLDHEKDRIPGAAGNSYLPTEYGFYYAGATIENTDYTVYSMVAEVGIGSYVAITGDKNSSGEIVWKKGYETLAEALGSAGEGSYVKLQKDITLYSAVTIGRDVTLDGDGHTILRGSGLNTAMFFITDHALTAERIILDGGANWHGTTEYTDDLQRYWLGTQTYGPIIQASGSSKLTFDAETTLRNNYNCCQATRNATGGAIYAEGTTAITLNGTKILDNYSDLFGSAIYFRDHTSLTINDCEMKGNSGSSKYNTSVLCADNWATCVVNDGNFHHNAGQAAGGVFWVCDGSLTINGGTFANNLASKGSTIYLKGSAKVQLGGTFEMQEVYLPKGKAVTITDEIAANSVAIVTEDSVGTGSVIIEDDVDTENVMSGLTINNKAPGINANGQLTASCSNGHTKAVDENGNGLRKTKTEANCSSPKVEYEYCSVCGARLEEYEVGEKDPINHCHVEQIAEIPATCTANGTTAGTRCKDCGEVLSGLEPIKATGHTYAKVSESNGLDKQFECSVCHAAKTQVVHQITVTSTGTGSVTATPATAVAGTLVTLSVTPGDEEQVQSLTITNQADPTASIQMIDSKSFFMPDGDVTITVTFAAAVQKTVVHSPAVAATCTAEGNLEFWRCDGKYYLTADLSEEVTWDKVVTSKLNHNSASFGNWSWTKLSGSDSWKASYSTCCTMCGGHVEEHSIVPNATENNGEITYTASVTIGGTTYTTSKTVQKTYTVTLDGDLYGTGTYSYGDVCSVTKEEGENYDWYVTYNGTETLVKTGSSSYDFVVVGNTAVTTREATAAKPTLSFVASDRESVTGTQKTKITFTLAWTVPTNCTFVEAGLYRAYGVTQNEFGIGDLTTKNVSTLKCRNGTYRYTVNMSAATSKKTIGAVGYLTYRDSNNVQHTIFYPNAPIFVPGNAS